MIKFTDLVLVVGLLASLGLAKWEVFALEHYVAKLASGALRDGYLDLSNFQNRLESGN